MSATLRVEWTGAGLDLQARLLRESFKPLGQGLGFLDPLADKVLVLGTMFALVANDTFWWPAVAIITVREVGIMGLRSYWGRKGLAIPATPMAKAKTVVQEVAVGLALCPLVVDGPMWIANVAMAVAVVLTVVSGIQYVVAGSRATTTRGSLAS